jgi:hypothetical protein
VIPRKKFGLGSLHWTYLIRKKLQNEEFFEFINHFMSTTFTIIHEEAPPRIFLDCKKLFHLSLNAKVGDWYIFRNHTKIRIYGVEVQPSKLPRFLTIINFSL